MSLEDLLRAVRAKDRDVMKESFHAGKVEAYETAMADLEHFAAEQIKHTSQ